MDKKIVIACPAHHQSLETIVASLRSLGYRCHRPDRGISNTGWHPIKVEWLDQLKDGVAEFGFISFFECSTYRVLCINFESGHAFFDAYDSIEHALDEQDALRSLPGDVTEMMRLRREQARRWEEGQEAQ